MKKKRTSVKPTINKCLLLNYTPERSEDRSVSGIYWFKSVVSASISSNLKYSSVFTLSLLGCGCELPGLNFAKSLTEQLCFCLLLRMFQKCENELETVMNAAVAIWRISKGSARRANLSACALRREER